MRQIARPHLEVFSAESGETTFVAIARGDHAVYVDKVVSDHPIRMDAPLGIDRPYNCTAIGKVLLTGMKDSDVERLAEIGVFEKRTENSIIDIDALLEELGQVRQRGWAEDNEEFSLGVSCLAAPICDHEGVVVAALTVSGPLDRVKDKHEELVQNLKNKAEQISKEMGFTPS